MRRVLAFAMLLLPLVANAVERVGVVVRVADGDTLTLLDDGGAMHRVRIDGIDAPERKQPYGDRARQSLVELTQGRGARAECAKSDRYGRDVCRVTVEGIDVGLEQVRRGLAWHYVKYAHEQAPEARGEYARVQEQARAMRIGLWSLDAPMPPWDYRRERVTAAVPR